MAQSVIGALRVNLGLDSAQFERGARRTRNHLRDMRQQFTRVAGAATALGAAITAMAMRGARDIDNLAKSARRIDASVGAFRALQLAASEAGVNIGTLTNELQNMQREVARGSTGAIAALERLGVTAEQLAQLDADEQMALLADRVQSLGLSAGETSALLRDLGIRNREMVLLLMQGGDAIRNARRDVDEYGLALSEVETTQIERANDQISRLGIVTQYAAQQIALQMVPALGRMAERITDSMREGETLRNTIDAMVANLDRLAAIVGVAVVAFGTRYVAALAAARIATMTLAGSLVALRAALIRTGIGIAIVAVGELVLQFTRLRGAVGSTSETFSMLGDLTREVFSRMGMFVQSFGHDFVAVTQNMLSLWLTLLSQMRSAWADFINLIGPSINRIAEFLRQDFRIDIEGAQASADELERGAEAASKAATRSRELSAEMRRMAREPLQALQAIRDVLAEAGENTEHLDIAIRKVGDNLEGIEGDGESAADGVDQFNSRLNLTVPLSERVASGMGQAFGSIVSGAQSARQAVSQLLQSIAQMVAQRAFMSAFAEIGLPGFANGTPFAPGGLALVGERGPELVNLPRGSQVIDAQRTKGMMGDHGGDTVINQTINVSTGVQQTVRTEIVSMLPQIAEASKRAVVDARKRGGGFAAAFGG